MAPSRGSLRAFADMFLRCRPTKPQGEKPWGKGQPLRQGACCLYYVHYQLVIVPINMQLSSEQLQFWDEQGVRG